MKLIFDFDDVIYDTKKFKEKVFAVCASQGISDVETLYAQYREKYAQFSLLTFLQKVLEEKVSPAQIQTLYEKMVEGGELFIDKEVMDLIDSVGAHNCYIVSQGEKVWQETKIQKSVGNLGFIGIFVVEGSKKEMIEKLCERHVGEEVIFIDDKVANCNEVVSDKTPNLKTVVYNHHGLENLKAEIEASLQEEEKKRVMREQEESIRMR